LLTHFFFTVLLQSFLNIDATLNDIVEIAVTVKENQEKDTMGE